MTRAAGECLEKRSTTISAMEFVKLLKKSKMEIFTALVPEITV